MAHGDPKPLPWARFTGAFANTAPAHADCSPTVGAAFHRCDCCGREYLVVAAIAEDGLEVNVSLSPLAALSFVERVATIVAEMGNPPSSETVQ